jgi:hypothetical protein
VKIEIEDYELEELIKQAVWNQCDGTYAKTYPNFQGLQLPSMYSQKVKDFAWFLADEVLHKAKKSQGA